MKFFILLVAVSSVICGIVDDDHERPTSYQNIHIEHFHPIPTYIKKEHKELLEHPVSLGTSSSKVEIHHGGKHDHGYGFANAENNIHGHAFGGEFESFAADAAEGHLGHAAALGHYGLGAGAQEGHYQSGAGAQEGHYQLGAGGQEEGHYQLGAEGHYGGGLGQYGDGVGHYGGHDSA